MARDSKFSSLFKISIKKRYSVLKLLIHCSCSTICNNTHTICHIQPLMFTMNSPRSRVYLLVLIKFFFCALRFFWHTLCHTLSYFTNCLLFWLWTVLFAFNFSYRSVLLWLFLVVCLFGVVCSCCCHIVLSLTTNFLSFKAYRQALWPTQLPTQLVMTLISHLHVVLRLSMCGAIPPLLFMVWCLIKHRYSFCFSIFCLISKTYQECNLFCTIMLNDIECFPMTLIWNISYLCVIFWNKFMVRF